MLRIPGAENNNGSGSGIHSSGPSLFAIAREDDFGGNFMSGVSMTACVFDNPAPGPIIKPSQSSAVLPLMPFIILAWAYHLLVCVTITLVYRVPCVKTFNRYSREISQLQHQQACLLASVLRAQLDE